MLNVPQVDGSFLMSPTTLIPIAVIIVGTLIALVALPHVRSKISDHLDAPKEYFYGDKNAPGPQEESKAAEEDATPTALPARRELEQFDLSIFEDD